MFSLDFITTDVAIGFGAGVVVGGTAGYFYGKSVGKEEAEKGVGLKQLEKMEGEMHDILSSMEKRIKEHKGQEPQAPTPVVSTPAAPVVVVEQAPAHAGPVVTDTPPPGHTWYQDGTGKALLVRNDSVEKDMLVRMQQLETELAKAKAKANHSNHNNGNGKGKNNNQKQNNQHQNQQQQQPTAKVVHVADDNAMGHAMANAGVVTAA